MPNVVRFTLASKTEIFVPGVGLIENGVFDVLQSDTSAVSAVRTALAVYAPTESVVDTSAVVTPPVSLPDPYPQYLNVSELSDPESAASVTLRAAFGRGLRPTGNRVTIMGTSLDANAYAGATNYYPHGRPSWFNRTCAQSFGRMISAGGVAVPGHTTQQIHDIQLPQVLAISPRPNACIVGGGPNEAAAGATSAWKALVRDICDQLRAAGIVPILKLEPPRGTQGAAANPTSTGSQAMNQWKAAYAAAEGIPTVDAYTPLVHSSGGITTAYGSGDGVHLSEQGYAVLAADVVTRQKLHELFPFPVPKTAKDKTDGTDLMAGTGVFVGSAPGWAQYATPGTISLVAASAGDDIAGSWLQAVRATGTTGDYLLQKSGLFPGMTPGDTVEVAYRLRVTGLTAHNGAVKYTSRLTMGHPDGTKYIDMFPEWGRDIDGTMIARVQLPAGVTSCSFEQVLTIGATVLSTDVTIKCAEVAIRNLTSGGLLTP